MKWCGNNKEQNTSVNCQFICYKNTHITTLQAKNSQQDISPPPSCLPHSAPECQKTVQWGVQRQRSAYGNAPDDTLLYSGEQEEMRPDRQRPHVYWLAYQHHCHSNFKYTSHAKHWHFLQRQTPPHRIFCNTLHYLYQAQEDYTWQSVQAQTDNVHTTAAGFCRVLLPSDHQAGGLAWSGHGLDPPSIHISM